MVSNKNRKARKQKSSRGGSNGSGVDEPSDNTTADLHHNLSNPCCSLVEQIVKEIFPEATKVNGSSDNDTSKDSSTTTAAVTQKQEVALLCRIARSYLLEQRQKERLQDPNHHTGGVGSSNNGEESLSMIKRKKRRKKKKPKPVTTSENPSATSTQEIQLEGRASIKAEESAATTAALIEETSSTRQSTAPTTHDVVAEHITRTEEVTGEPNATQPNDIDLFLDRLLDQGADKASLSVPNRDLPAFVSYLSQRCQQQHPTQTTTKSPKKKSKENGESNQSSHLKNVLPTVDVKDVEVARDLIGCRVCRSAVQAHTKAANIFGGFKNNLHSVQIRPKDVSIAENSGFSSSLSVPISGIRNEFDSDMDVERAFDYVAMEEGGAVASEQDGATDSLSLALDVVVDSKGQSQMLQMKELSCEDQDGAKAFPLTVKDVEELIRRILLPCGLNETDAHQEYVLSDQEFGVIQKQVDKEEPALSTKIDSIGVEIQKVRRELDKMENSTPTAFDTRTTSALYDCDTTANKLLDDLKDVLRSVTDTYHSLVAHRDCHRQEEVAVMDWLEGNIQEMWRLFHMTIMETSREILMHEGRVMHLATRPGSVPQMFLSNSHRFSYQEMLSKKLDALAGLSDHFGKTLFQQPRDKPPTLSTTLCTYQAFYSTIHGKRNGDNKQQYSCEYTKRMDERCASLLQAYGKLAHTVKCASVSDLIAAQESRYKTLRNLVMELNTDILEAPISQCVRDEGKSGSGTESVSLNDLRLEFEELENETLLSESADDVSDVSDSSQPTGWTVERERLNLLDATRNVLTQWTLVKCKMGPHQLTTVLESDNNNAKASRLPFKLRRWMETRHLGTSNGGSNGSSSSCSGGGGQRRVACIISGLLFRWLCDRCMEWHAELTQHELLDSMDDASTLGKNSIDSTTAGAGSSSAKSGKKAKKKKKAKKSSVVPAERKATTGDKGENGISAPTSTSPRYDLVEQADALGKQRTSGKEACQNSPQPNDKVSKSKSEKTEALGKLNDMKDKDQTSPEQPNDKKSKSKSEKTERTVDDHVEQAEALRKQPHGVKDKNQGSPPQPNEKKSRSKLHKTGKRTPREEHVEQGEALGKQRNGVKNNDQSSPQQPNGIISKSKSEKTETAAGDHVEQAEALGKQPHGVKGKDQSSPPQPNENKSKSKSEKAGDHVEQAEALGKQPHGVDDKDQSSPPQPNENKSRAKLEKTENRTPREDHVERLGKQRNGVNNQGQRSPQQPNDKKSKSKWEKTEKKPREKSTKEGEPKKKEGGREKSGKARKKSPRGNRKSAKAKDPNNTESSSKVQKKSPRGDEMTAAGSTEEALPEKTDRGESHSQEEKSRMLSLRDSRVGVVDDYGSNTGVFQSAEEYLVARLAAVLKDAQDPRNSRDHDIIFM